MFSVSPSLSLSLSRSLVLSIYLAICLSICLSVCLSICLSSYLSIHQGSESQRLPRLLYLTLRKRYMLVFRLQADNYETST